MRYSVLLLVMVGFASARLQREWVTVQVMIDMYCADHHDPAECSSCPELKDYCEQKLGTCRFGENKPTCANCSVHCYRKSKREEIRGVMRYAGPKMVYRHPWLALRHLIDGRRQTPAE